ncbi:MAG: tetratricopeptide repeat protein [Candidatus Hydrogenedentes bacterium]|nr:tetratricopeptide repeat protein [Candidatus Hydrogenedentota bacterium]
MNFVTVVAQAGAGDKITAFPVWSTFVILLVVVVELIVGGIFLKRKWLEKHEALPLPAALAMLFLMMSLYVLVGSSLYFSGSEQQRPPILFWTFVLYIPIGIQYALNVVNAIVWQLTKHVSPVADKILESPALVHAQKLVMAGRIDDAVTAYTSYYEREAPALAEVARLLKSEGKFDEATAIYVNLVKNHQNDRVAWPEAVYTLGKIYETHMGKAAEAIKLYKRLLDEAPESRFTHLAGADMARLMVMDAGFIKSLQEDDDSEIPEDPFYVQHKHFLQQQEKEQDSETNEEQQKVEGEKDIPEVLEDAIAVSDDASISSGTEEKISALDVIMRGKSGIRSEPTFQEKSEESTKNMEAEEEGVSPENIIPGSSEKIEKQD